MVKRSLATQKSWSKALFEPPGLRCHLLSQAHVRACRRCEAGMTLGPDDRRGDADDPVGVTTSATPVAIAADNRASRPGTGLIAPVSDSSPTKALPGGGAFPLEADARAAAMA